MSPVPGVARRPRSEVGSRSSSRSSARSARCPSMASRARPTGAMAHAGTDRTGVSLLRPARLPTHALDLAPSVPRSDRHRRLADRAGDEAERHQPRRVRGHVHRWPAHVPARCRPPAWIRASGAAGRGTGMTPETPCSEPSGRRSRPSTSRTWSSTTSAPVVLHDDVLGDLAITAEGFPNRVVWNPGRAPALPDVPPGDGGGVRLHRADLGHADQPAGRADLGGSAVADGRLR